MNYRIDRVTFSVVREPGTPRRCRVSSPEEAVRVVRELIPDDAREHFLLLMLDAQNGIVATHEASVGTLTEASVHAREIFGPALRVMGVASIILAHNHPSGDPTPSRDDLRLTTRLAQAAKLLELRIHDHIIIGNGTDAHVSMATLGGIL